MYASTRPAMTVPAAQKASREKTAQMIDPASLRSRAGSSPMGGLAPRLSHDGSATTDKTNNSGVATIK